MGHSVAIMQSIIDALTDAGPGAEILFVSIRSTTDSSTAQHSLSELIRRGAVRKRRIGRTLRISAIVWPPSIPPSRREQDRLRRLADVERAAAVAPCRRYVDGKLVETGTW